MKIIRKANVGWVGGLKDGKGEISTPSGALQNYPYGFSSRFEGVAGSNPEELLGAAHAACFTMSITAALDRAGFKADRLDTEAKVELESVEGGFSIPRIELSLKAQIPGISVQQFEELAAAAEKNCPVSKLFKAEIVLTATLA